MWEYTKCQLRTDTIIYSCKKAKENKKLEIELQKRAIDFENKLSTENNIEEIKYQEYIRAKSDWEGLIAKKNSGIILRFKAKWVEEGEQKD